jgi:hypothetical protein
MNRLLTHTVAFGTGAALAVSAAAFAGTVGTQGAPTHSDMVNLNRSVQSLGSTLSTLNTNLDSRMFKLCRATATNPAYTGCN